MATFFNPVSRFDYDEGEIQSANEQLSKVRFVSPDGMGGFAPCATSAYQPRTERTEVYHIHKAAGTTFTTPAVGATINGWRIQSVRVEHSCEAWPVVTVVGHRHGDAEHWATGDGLTFTPSLAFPSGFGVVPSWCGDGGRSSTYVLEAEQAVLTDEESEVVACELYGGIETVTGETTNAAPIPPAEGWVQTGGVTDEQIQDIHYRSAEFTRTFTGAEAL